MNTNEFIAKGLLLLLLLISGNFLGESFNCKTQKLLKNNMIIKHVIIILTVFFTLDFNYESDIKFSKMLLETLAIWILFVLFTKMNYKFTITVLFLTIIQYMIYTQVKRIKNKNKTENKYIEYLDKFNNYLLYFIIFIILIGSTHYYLDKRNTYKKSWSSMKFLLGTPYCKK